MDTTTLIRAVEQELSIKQKEVDCLRAALDHLRRVEGELLIKQQETKVAGEVKRKRNGTSMTATTRR